MNKINNNDLDNINPNQEIQINYPKEYYFNSSNKTRDKLLQEIFINNIDFDKYQKSIEEEKNKNEIFLSEKDSEEENEEENENSQLKPFMYEPNEEFEEEEESEGLTEKEKKSDYENSMSSLDEQVNEEELEKFMRLDLTDEEREMILHKNAEKLLNISL